MAQRRRIGRSTVLQAGADALLKRGIAHVKLSDVAEAAGISSPGVLYHFPHIFALFDDAFARSAQQYCEARRAAVDAETGAVQKLRACIASGVPTSPEMREATRLLIELQPYVLREPSQRDRWQGFMEEQVAAYVSALDAGVAEGVFTPTAPVADIAADLLALEDGYAARVLGGFVSPDEVRSRMWRFAESTCNIRKD